MVDLPQAPVIDKEKEKALPREEVSRMVPVVEAGKVPEILEEKKAREEGYLERVEKEAELRKPVVHKGKVLVTAPSAQPPKIVLPVAKRTYLDPKNWHLPVTTALRWLLTWAKRIIKMYPGRVIFGHEPTT